VNLFDEVARVHPEQKEVMSAKLMHNFWLMV
jgi:hypothetical protein